MQEFLSVIKTDTKLGQMIDEKQLRKLFDEKVNNRQSEAQLIPLDENRRISNRYQASILQGQNNDLNRQIQNNRARTLVRQNELSSISINHKGSLNRFQKMVKEITLSTQIGENKQIQRAEQEI